MAMERAEMSGGGQSQTSRFRERLKVTLGGDLSLNPSVARIAGRTGQFRLRVVFAQVRLRPGQAILCYADLCREGRSQRGFPR
jgi:hypothetical protein